MKKNFIDRIISMYRCFTAGGKAKDKMQLCPANGIRREKTRFVEWQIVYSDEENSKEENANVFF
jgi:hypothetical protein